MKATEGVGICKFYRGLRHHLYQKGQLSYTLCGSGPVEGDGVGEVPQKWICKNCLRELEQEGGERDRSKDKELAWDIGSEERA